MSPKLSVSLDRNLPQTYRQTVPQTRPCNSKASVTKSVVKCLLIVDKTASATKEPSHRTDRSVSVYKCDWTIVREILTMFTYCIPQMAALPRTLKPGFMQQTPCGDVEKKAAGRLADDWTPLCVWTRLMISRDKFTAGQLSATPFTLLWQLRVGLICLQQLCTPRVSKRTNLFLFCVCQIWTDFNKKNW